jgi:hypothetical protein
MDASRSLRFLSVVIALAWITGCGGVQPPLVRSAGSAVTTSVGTPPEARGGGQLLYVGGNTISEYVLGHTHPRRSVAADDAVAAMATDSLGNLLVISVYGSAEKALQIYDSRTLQTLSGYGPFGVSVAVDPSNYVYLRGYGEITVLAPGGTEKLRSMRKDVSWIGPMAFDKAGYLYVGSISSVSVFAPTSRPGRLKFWRKIANGIKSPVALAFDSADDLVVANCPRCPYSQPGKRKDWISLYAANGAAPFRRFNDGVDGEKEPRALAVDSTGRIYVANYNFGESGPQHGGGVAVYTAGSNRPVKTILRGIDAPSALALDPADKLYVANSNGGNVTVYSPGGASLLETIKDGVRAPQSLLITSPKRL